MSLPTRSEGLAIAIDDDLRGVFALGLLEALQVRHAPLGADFAAERDRVIGRIVGAHSGRAAADIAGVAEVRALFHALDIDPTKTRPSSEALLRRTLQGKGLPTVSPVVDVCNLCSLEHQMPLGLYDRELVGGTVRVRVGLDGEGYDGIRKAHVNLAGRLLLADDSGPFGAPTSDSLRTSVTERTLAVLVVVFCPRERAEAELMGMLESLSDRLARFCGGDVAAVRVIR